MRIASTVLSLVPVGVYIQSEAEEIAPINETQSVERGFCMAIH